MTGYVTAITFLSFMKKNNNNGKSAVLLYNCGLFRQCAFLCQLNAGRVCTFEEIPYATPTLSTM
jgi:hypothetical protein